MMRHCNAPFCLQCFRFMQHLKTCLEHDNQRARASLMSQKNQDSTSCIGRDIEREAKRSTYCGSTAGLAFTTKALTSSLVSLQSWVSLFSEWFLRPFLSISLIFGSFVLLFMLFPQMGACSTRLLSTRVHLCLKCCSLEKR